MANLPSIWTVNFSYPRAFLSFRAQARDPRGRRISQAGFVSARSIRGIRQSEPDSRGSFAGRDDSTGSYRCGAIEFSRVFWERTHFACCVRHPCRMRGSMMVGIALKDFRQDAERRRPGRRIVPGSSSRICRKFPSNFSR